VFLLLSQWLDDAQFLAWGWRIPFLASALLVLVGLWVRLRLAETPDFERALARNERVEVPIVEVVRFHPRALVLGMFAATATFVLFYLMTVFALSWGTTSLGFARTQFLQLQMIGVLFFAVTIPLSAIYADRHGTRAVLIFAQVAIVLFGFVFAPLFSSGATWAVVLCLAFGLGVMGFTYGPLGSGLGELFPTAVRYTGTSLAFNAAGIVGASLAPYLATWLATRYGLVAVGAYLAVAGLVSLLALLGLRPLVATTPRVAR
jgi:MFS family permease